MKIDILCSSSVHPVNAMLEKWKSNHLDHEVRIIRKKEELAVGDLLFLISCSEILREDSLKHYVKSLVIHASDLPQGRGWSPHIWAVIEGQCEIVVTLLEAAEFVDSGDIWKKIHCDVPKTALFEEINDIVFDAERQLMDFAVENFHNIKPIKQIDIEGGGYYPKRTPQDSQIDPNKTLADQFDLIRVCDNQRFPAYFEYRGSKYKIVLEKI